MKNTLCAILCLLTVSGCAATSTTSLVYTTPGSCHFDFQTHYSVRYENGDRQIVTRACESTEQVLAARQ